mmetsp:Transcript_100811/g.260520  ORF Transcript_100811/g.260520 Transcript_100811/m.260520 type:complete len:216 (-) Transcript_100811:161-808(-)
MADLLANDRGRLGLRAASGHGWGGPCHALGPTQPATLRIWTVAEARGNAMPVPGAELHADGLEATVSCGRPVPWLRVASLQVEVAREALPGAALAADLLCHLLPVHMAHALRSRRQGPELAVAEAQVRRLGDAVEVVDAARRRPEADLGGGPEVHSHLLGYAHPVHRVVLLLHQLPQRAARELRAQLHEELLPLLQLLLQALRPLGEAPLEHILL